MKLIVGLGNPGQEYAQTRHNFGFLAVDFLQREWGFPSFSLRKDFSATLSSGERNGEKVFLVQPQTMMNASGQAVAKLLSYYKLTPSDIAVVHDDMDLPFGTVRAAASSRSAGHNGVQDIIDALGTQDFFRARLGIGRPTETLGVCLPAHDYVLARFTDDEMSQLPDILATAEAALANEFLAGEK